MWNTGNANYIEELNKYQSNMTTNVINLQANIQNKPHVGPIQLP